MLLLEKYEKMDWASYGAQERREGELKGACDQLVRSARRMRKKGYKDSRINY